MPRSLNRQRSPLGDEISGRDVLTYRILLAVGAGVIVLLGFINIQVDPDFVDPWSDRLAVTGVILGALALSFAHRSSALRLAIYFAGYVTTAWIVLLLFRNEFHYHFALGLMVAIPAISTVFVRRSHLVWYVATTVALVGTAAVATAEPQIPLVSYLFQIGALCLLCTLMLGARLQTQEELTLSEERYALAAEAANDGLWDWDLLRERIYYAPRWKAMLGYSNEEIDTLPNEWLSRVHPADLPRVHAEIDALRQGAAGPFELEHRMTDRDGGTRWMLVRGKAVQDEGGHVVRMVGSQSDVTARKSAEKQLQHDALHDALTGLPNRVLFMDRLERLIQRTQRQEAFQFAVFLVDLDRFEGVNKSKGHAVGDEILRTVARRLMRVVRVEDTTARLGDDEFGLLLADTEEVGGPVRVAERIDQALTTPFEVDGDEIFLSGTIGIALSSTGYATPEEVLRDAGAALYRAKVNRTGAFEIFDQEVHTRSIAMLTLESELRRGLDRGEFHAYFQPIVRFDTGAIAGFEALARWHHPERGFLLPAEFIEVAEESGLILPLGEQILRQASRHAFGWAQHRSNGTPLTLAVNISGRQCGSSGLAETVDGILEETAFEPTNLHLEITESAIMRDAAAAAEALTRFRNRGIRVALDDFGTGYSSLSYLHRFPVDALKIDRSFVEGMAGNGRSGSEIIETVVTLARSLGMSTVAEGVETEEQRLRLAELGCTFAQGFLFSQAVGPEEARRLLDTPPRWLTAP